MFSGCCLNSSKSIWPPFISQHLQEASIDSPLSSSKDSTHTTFRSVLLCQWMSELGQKEMTDGSCCWFKPHKSGGFISQLLQESIVMWSGSKEVLDVNHCWPSPFKLGFPSHHFQESIVTRVNEWSGSKEVTDGTYCKPRLLLLNSLQFITFSSIHYCRVWRHTVTVASPRLNAKIITILHLYSHSQR